jgi:hypothetical protein
MSANFSKIIDADGLEFFGAVRILDLSPHQLGLFTFHNVRIMPWAPPPVNRKDLSQLPQNLPKRLNRINPTSPAPEGKLSHVNSAVGTLTIVNPRLRFLELFPEITLCHPRRFTQVLEEQWKRFVGRRVLRLGHFLTFAGFRFDTR